MARTPRSAAEKLAMRKKKSRALLLFNIIAFSVVVIGAVLLCIFVFFKVGDVTFTSDAGYDEADIRRVCGINEGDNLVLLETESREKMHALRQPRCAPAGSHCTTRKRTGVGICPRIGNAHGACRGRHLLKFDREPLRSGTDTRS